MVQYIMEFILVSGVSFVLFFIWKFKFWENAGVQCIKPSIPWGNVRAMVTGKQSLGDLLKELYLKMKSKGFKHAGLYLFYKPIYVPIDTEIVKYILLTGYKNFQDRGLYHNEKDDPFSMNLFVSEGERWKILRAKLTPTFSPNKIKILFDTMLACCKPLADEITKNHERPVDIKDIASRFTTDVIGSCAYGIECNSLKDPKALFRDQAVEAIELSVWENCVFTMCFLWPNFMRKLGVRFFRKSATTFFLGTIKETVAYREKHNVVRNDFMQLLIQIKNKDPSKTNDVSLTVVDMAAQAFVFFIAGFGTSAFAISLCMYELSLNNEIQTKVRQEIATVLKKNDDILTYESLAEMTYLDMVVNETMRKHPPTSVLNRICTKDCAIPGTDLVINKGTLVFIPVHGIHHDPEFYPNPEIFDPERFSKDRNRVPFTFLPFGDGPKICLGLRFGLINVKLGLIEIIKNYTFTLNESLTKQPLKMDPTQTILNNVKDDIYLNMKKIK